MSVLVYDHYSHVGKCIGLSLNTGLFLSTGNIFPTPITPFRLLTTAPVLIFLVWRQNFAVGVPPSDDV